MSESNCKTAKQVYRAERELAIKKRRDYWDAKAKKSDPAQAYPPPSDKDLVGLALSGGGIRSAMFNLGLLQAFERAGLMKHVDYLASVSGGGYTNGYYSTLRNSQESRANDDTRDNEITKQLSPRDTQFLLDGQYLNRPIEFLTTYLVRTAIMVVTMVSFLVAVSCLIALYFRWFDQPNVRSWLGLFDISNDLRAGLFSSGVAALIVLCIRGLVIAVLRIRATPFRANPGQWALIIVGAFLLGISIMIGSGDFAFSATGLPSWDLGSKQLQLPIIIAVFLLLSPMLRFSSLLKSEKSNATVYQKIALWLILTGTTWGAIFAMVGWMGMENISGFITYRPPTFELDDIKDYGEFASLIKLEGKSIFGRDYSGLIPLCDKIIQLKDKRIEADAELHKEQSDWHSWTEFSNGMLSRWVQTFSAWTMNVQEGPVHEHIQSTWAAKQVGALLADIVEKSIKPDAISTDSERLEYRLESLKEQNLLTQLESDAILEWVKESSIADSSNKELNPKLRLRTASQIASATFEQSKVDESKIKDVNLSKLNESAAVASNQSFADQSGWIISTWLAKGGLMLTKEQKPYKDASEFQTIFDKAWPTRGTWQPENLSPLELWKLNRMFLEIAYPRVFKERKMISTPVVVAEDQKFRLLVLFWSSTIFIVCAFLLDLNWVCAWFHFYRERVRETFLVHTDGDGIAGQSGPQLKDLKPYEIGYPYPMFVAGMVLPQAPAYARSVDNSDHRNPTKLDGSFASNWYSFLFSPLYCGWLPCVSKDDRLTESELVGDRKTVEKSDDLRTYRKTRDFPIRNLGVDDAVVLSGAAVTPYMSENISMRLLMHVFNFRLEQWLPNPELAGPCNRRFSLFRMAREFLFSRISNGSGQQKVNWRYCVVADGGCREFLGVEELIARRCKVIIISDAGCNNGLYEFGVLAELIRKMRLDHSVDILDLDHDRPLDTRRLRRTVELDGKSPQHYVLGRMRYPEKLADCGDGESPNEEALLVYVQMSVTGDEDIDIEQFRRTNPSFPDEPISNQFYSREQVESFRQLGEHIGKLLCRDVSRFNCPATELAPLDSSETLNPHERMQEWRIRKLEDSFRSSYRNECRQEGFVASDDARIGWILDVEHLEKATRCAIHRYESQTNHEQQLLIRDFVWNALDQTGTRRTADYDAIRPADLFGIAVECNRRHAGFRPEWPTSYFQVCGRDLLTKASQKAEFMLSPDYKLPDNGLDGFVAWYSGESMESSTPALVNAFSRLAVMLPRGVFRKNGCRTSAEVLVCLMAYVIRIKLQKPNASLDWISSESAQILLRKVIGTGKAIEVEKVLCRLLTENKNSLPRVPTAVE